MEMRLQSLPVISDVTATHFPLFPTTGLPRFLITHHCEGHELQDASTTSLLQAFDALLHETLYKLGMWSRHLGAQDGGNEKEKVGWGEGSRWQCGVTSRCNNEFK